MTIVAKLFLTAPLATLIFSASAFGTEQGMPSMPLIKEKRVFTVSPKDDLQSEQGFGDQEPMVKMMNLMMVEGSGMEGMSMDMAPGKEMAPGMKMGSGMKMAPGMKMSANEKMPAESASETAKTSEPQYLVDAKSLTPPKAGTDLIQVSVLDLKSKKPVKGLKLKAQVYMTSMDMGTETPLVKESKNGGYELKAPFAMKGPWAVKLIFPDKTEKVFNFEVAGK
jgi:hypothetical protein